MGSNDNVRTVYSTATDGNCRICGWPQRSCMCSSQQRQEPVPDRIVAKLRTEKKGRGGKTVTVVYGLPRNDSFLKDLGQRLKRECGTGGSVTENTIELQGEMPSPRNPRRTSMRKTGSGSAPGSASAHSVAASASGNAKMA